MKSERVQSNEVRRMALPLVFAALCLSGAVSAGSLTPQDRQHGLDYLMQTRDGVVETTRGLSEAQWKFKPGPDRWSVAEIVEHLALAEDFLFLDITENVLKAQAGRSDRDHKGIDRMILSVIPDRTTKATAPEPLVPKGQWAPAAALGHFVESRARTSEFLKSAPDLREHVVDSPFGQPMDAYQWLLLVAAHSERHTKQILEVKGDPSFPKH